MYIENHAIVVYFKRGFADEQKKRKVSVECSCVTGFLVYKGADRCRLPRSPIKNALFGRLQGDHAARKALYLAALKIVPAKGRYVLFCFLVSNSIQFL